MITQIPDFVGNTLIKNFVYGIWLIVFLFMLASSKYKIEIQIVRIGISMIPLLLFGIIMDLTGGRSFFICVN
ncbi:hypothetical protein ACI2OX_19420 [Bacillus sp. N9]